MSAVSMLPWQVKTEGKPGENRVRKPGEIRVKTTRKPGEVKTPIPPAQFRALWSGATGRTGNVGGLP